MWDFLLWLLLLLLVALSLDFASILRGLASLGSIAVFVCLTWLYFRALLEF